MNEREKEIQALVDRFGCSRNTAETWIDRGFTLTVFGKV